MVRDVGGFATNITTNLYILHTKTCHHNITGNFYSEML